ncbi:MAG: hypothetical protein WAW96_00560 [Alphaproteobacteria bacterium]
MMSRFRKKPIEVEAVEGSVLLRLAKNAWRDLPVWLRRAHDEGKVRFLPHGIEIKTLEGVLTARSEDWVICGLKDEIYPCKPDIFAASYEPIS